MIWPQFQYHSPQRDIPLWSLINNTYIFGGQTLFIDITIKTFLRKLTKTNKKNKSKIFFFFQTRIFEMCVKIETKQKSIQIIIQRIFSFSIYIFDHHEDK